MSEMSWQPWFSDSDSETQPPEYPGDPIPVISGTTCRGRKGRKRALCIGISYFGRPYYLHGCNTHAKDIHLFLTRNHKYKAGDIVLLADDLSHPRQRPTKRNIIDAMRWLVQDARPNDTLFFFYSGHGNQAYDRDGDEVDGKDEVILPVDYETAGPIVDDLMHQIMVKNLPIGCRLTALFDSKHSGSMLDLPYMYHTDGSVKDSPVTPEYIPIKSSLANVISWGGCSENGNRHSFRPGAMTYAFRKALENNPHPTYEELLQSIRRILYDMFGPGHQHPQLSAAHHIDTNLQVII